MNKWNFEKRHYPCGMLQAWTGGNLLHLYVRICPNLFTILLVFPFNSLLFLIISVLSSTSTIQTLREMMWRCELQARKLRPWCSWQESAFTRQPGSGQSLGLASSFISKRQISVSGHPVVLGTHKSYLRDRADVQRPDVMQSLLPKPEGSFWGKHYVLEETGHVSFFCVESP